MFLNASLVTLVACALALAQDPAVRAQEAKQLLGAGKFQEAAAIYQDLVRQIPGNPGLLMNLGIALHLAGEERKAIPHLSAAVKLQPGLTPAVLFLGASFLRSGQARAAIPHLEKVVTAQPDYHQARELLAQALFADDRIDRAAAEYRKLAEASPHDPKIWHALGRSYEALARRAFADLSRTGPDSAYLVALIAETRLNQQQYSPAYFLYRQALERDANTPAARTAIAEIYRKTGHPDWAAREEALITRGRCSAATVECDFESRQFLKIVTSAAPNKTPEGYYWLTRAYNELAREAFGHLHQLPDSPELHQHLAETRRGQRRHREAVEEWRKALALSPQEPRLMVELAQSLYEARDYEEARQITSRLLELDPDSVEMNHLHGEILLSLQQLREAVTHLRKSIARAPQLLPAQAALGRALALSGKTEESIPHLEAALRVDEDGSLHYQLARAYQATGKPELAKQMLEKYAAIQKGRRSPGMLD